MIPPSSDDDVLVERCRRGDPAALATLYRRHATPLLAHLERLFGTRADAEDVLHEAFLRVFLGSRPYRGRGRFRAWLFTVGTHLALDRIRQQRRRDALARLAIEAISPAPARDPVAEAERRELAGRIDAALADLPASHAMAFHLRVREAFSYREIADMCGEPEGTLRSRVHHALNRIRRALEPRGTTTGRGPSDRPAGRREESSR